MVQMYGSIAQLGEHLPYKQRVTGSSPVVPTIISHYEWRVLREWLSGRASPCQGECREFESRLPLHKHEISSLGDPMGANILMRTVGAIAKW